ncbi:MAG: hypothetical protein H7327_05220 [Herminiimonas sp.]|nr:hypothetical protein [Herminiimonas sp.]
MYLDHPLISATNSDTEPDRVERLNRVYGYAIALADADGNRDCIAKLVRLHDHKGNLVVSWRSPPTAREKSFLLKAWQSQVGDLSENVSHEMDETPA